MKDYFIAKNSFVPEVTFKEQFSPFKAMSKNRVWFNKNVNPKEVCNFI